MFLGMLNEKEGKNFLELANIAMMANGDEVKEAEKAVLQAFKLELEMQDYVIKNKKQEELITAFQASTKKIKKAVIIELAGVLDADEGIDDIEDSWIRKLGEDLGPEGGDGGGTVIAQGTPEEVAEVPESYTGYYVKKYLEKDK